MVTAEDTCDGIIVYHNLIQKYKYGGDRETYKSKLVILIHTQYYDGFPGGGIAYLDRWEDSTVRLANVSPNEAHTSDSKRSLFALLFTTPSTENMIESVKDTTETWDEMSDSLRTKLTRRAETESRHASKNTRINNVKTRDQISSEENYCGSLYNLHIFVMTINSHKKLDYNIGYDLWIALSKDEQELFKQIRNTEKTKQREQKSKNKNPNPNLKTVDSIVKKAEDKAIPKQYGRANTTILEQIGDDNEEINNISIIDYVIDNEEGVQAVENIRANNTRFYVSLVQ